MEWYEGQSDGIGVQDKHLDFFRHHVNHFIKSGGTIHLNDYGPYKSFELEARDSNNKSAAKMEILRAHDVTFNHPGNPQWNWVHVVGLQSNHHTPGAATTIEYALAHMAHKNNKGVWSQASNTAVPYHLKIGRNVDLSDIEDEDVDIYDSHALKHIDWAPESYWYPEDCHEIAKLNLLPKSITRTLQSIPTSPYVYGRAPFLDEWIKR